MSIKEFVAKLKEVEGATATERLETLRELVEVSELDLDTIVRIAKALHDPELTCEDCNRKFTIPSEYMEEIPFITKRVNVPIRCPACCENPYERSYLAVMFSDKLLIPKAELRGKNVVITHGRILVCDKAYRNVIAFEGIKSNKRFNIWNVEDLRACFQFIRDPDYDAIIAYDAILKACRLQSETTAETIVIDYHPDNTPEENSATLSDGTRIEVNSSGVEVIPVPERKDGGSSI